MQVEVEAEFEDLSAQLFEAQQKVHELQQSLTESDAKRCAPRDLLTLIAIVFIGRCYVCAAHQSVR